MTLSRFRSSQKALTASSLPAGVNTEKVDRGWGCLECPRQGCLLTHLFRIGYIATKGRQMLDEHEFTKYIP